MPQIALSARAEHNKGFFAEVDDEDYASLAHFRWNVHRAPGSLTIYAKRQLSTHEGRGWVFMHQQVLGKVPGAEIDHRDGNGLNNRRGNLRHVTHAENVRAFHRRRNDALVDAWLAEQEVISARSKPQPPKIFPTNLQTGS